MLTSTNIDTDSKHRIERKLVQEQTNRMCILNRRNEQNQMRVHQITHQFNRLLSKLNQDRILYAFNVLPRYGYIEKYVKERGVTRETNEDSVERFLIETYGKLIHWISSSIEPKYNKRPRHREKTIKSLLCLEHAKKNDSSTNISPHIHALIAVHPDWDEKFLLLFEKHEHRDKNNRNIYFLDHEFFMERGLYELNHIITKTSLKDRVTEAGWIGYAADQLTNDFQGTGVYLHQGYRLTPPLDKQTQ